MEWSPTEKRDGEDDILPFIAVQEDPTPSRSILEKPNPRRITQSSCPPRHPPRSIRHSSVASSKPYRKAYSVSGPPQSRTFTRPQTTLPVGTSLRKALELSKRTPEVEFRKVVKRPRYIPCTPTPSPSLESATSSSSDSESLSSHTTPPTPIFEAEEEKSPCGPDYEGESEVSGWDLDKVIFRLEKDCEEKDKRIKSIEEERDDHQLAALDAEKEAAEVKQQLAEAVKEQGYLRETVEEMKEHITEGESRTGEVTQERDDAELQFSAIETTLNIIRKAGLQDKRDFEQKLDKTKADNEMLTEDLRVKKRKLEETSRRLLEAEAAARELREQVASLEARIKIKSTLNRVHPPTPVGHEQARLHDEIHQLRWSLSTRESQKQAEQAASANYIYGLQTRIQYLEAAIGHAERDTMAAHDWRQRVEKERNAMATANRCLAKRLQDLGESLKV